MKGLTLSLNKAAKQLTATVDPLLIDDALLPEAVHVFIESSEHKGVYLLADGIASLCEKSNKAKESDSLEEQHAVVGEIRDASVVIKLIENNMAAEMVISSPHLGSIPSYPEVIALLNENGVKRGISKKRINTLLFEASEGASGVEFSNIIARGLPAKDGRASYVKPLFPNALERILEPQETDNNKVDMRNLGDILCVQVNTPVAQRNSPSKGRVGYDVTGEPLTPNEGEWQAIKLGGNTELSPGDENLVIATVTGQPKFENDVMSVDDTFQTKGVNVGTGNINYDGAVIVNGDVTESMQVTAKGDITINGFVESATIKAGGDIIITEGAMGKMNEEDCRLYAEGSVFVQHGQGLDIVANKNLNVRKQLAYSRVTCKGTVTIGNPDKPMGSIFASTIQCGSTVYAGTIGAVSGSALTIDFSDSINVLNKRYDALLVLLKQLRENNFDHVVMLREMRAKHVPNAMINQMNKIEALVESEKHLLEWLEKVETELSQARTDYDKNARVIAYKELFPGVSIKMNKRNWRSEKEYQKSMICLSAGKWEYQPIVK